MARYGSGVPNHRRGVLVEMVVGGSHGFRRPRGNAHAVVRLGSRSGLGWLGLT